MKKERMIYFAAIVLIMIVLFVGESIMQGWWEKHFLAEQCEAKKGIWQTETQKCLTVGDSLHKK